MPPRKRDNFSGTLCMSPYSRSFQRLQKALSVFSAVSTYRFRGKHSFKLQMSCDTALRVKVGNFFEYNPDGESSIGRTSYSKRSAG